jgi:hypothetical protein
MDEPRMAPAALPEAKAKRFLDHFAKHLDEKGEQAIQALYDTKLYDYLRIAIALLPKELPGGASLLGEMSDADLARTLESVQRLMAAERPVPPG